MCKRTTARGQHETKAVHRTISVRTLIFFYRTCTGLLTESSLFFAILIMRSANGALRNYGGVHKTTIGSIVATVQRNNLRLIRLNVFIALQGNGERGQWRALCCRVARTFSCFEPSISLQANRQPMSRSLLCATNL